MSLQTNKMSEWGKKEGEGERRAGERKKNHSCTGPYGALYRLHCIAVRRGRATLPEVKDRPSRKVRVRIG